MDKNAVYEKTCALRTLDFDRYYNVKPSALLDIFQFVAGEHTVLFSCDKNNMLARGLYWVLVSVRIDFAFFSPDIKALTVKTWPLKSNGVRYFRNFSVTDEMGNIVASARSLWAVLNSQTKRVTLGAKVYPENFSYCEDELGGRLSRLTDTESKNLSGSFYPSFSDLDYNGHMNNAKYADHSLDFAYSGIDRKIASLQIDYHKEILYGEKINVFSGENDKTIKLKGADESGSTRFLTEIIYR